MRSGALLHYLYNCIVIGCLNAIVCVCACVYVCKWAGRLMGRGVYYNIIF